MNGAQDCGTTKKAGNDRYVAESRIVRKSRTVVVRFATIFTALTFLLNAASTRHLSAAWVTTTTSTTQLKITTYVPISSVGRASVSVVPVPVRDTRRFVVGATISAYPSDMGTVEVTLNTRGIFYDIRSMAKLQPPNDFHIEWNKFVDAVADATGLQASETRHSDAAAAFQCFFHVMNQTDGYRREEDFQKHLFQALGKSLGEFCEKQNNPSKLKNASIGFVREVGREARLGFPSGYGLSRESRPDLACVVYGEGDNVDTTAIVELKLHDTGCAALVNIKGPNLAGEHAVLGQTLLYTMDVWHCLARRGYSMEHGGFLSFAVLSALRNNAKPRRLCCVEGHVNIPKTLGGVFVYTIDQCIPFPNETEEDKELQYTQALAIFIKTLRFGVTRGQALQTDKDRVATPLCCSAPIPNLELLASPIPRGKSPASGWKISQGELFRVTGSGISIQDWMQARNVETTERLLFTDEKTLLDGCLIKVSCRSVHNSLVSLEKNWQALANSREQMTPGVSTVLVACAILSNHCHVTLMRDLSHLSVKEHPTHGFVALHDLWQAFRRLVDNVLLPMASKKVVHIDIRFNPDQWGFSNVLCIRSESHETPVELALIDFESLINCGLIFSDVEQDFAISPLHIVAISASDIFIDATAHQVTFWQVLYAAYLWSTEPSHTLQIAWRFVAELFASDGTGTTVKDGDLLTSFRARMGEDAMGELCDIWGRLCGPEGGDPRAAASIVQEAMGVIQKTFEAELGPAES